MLTPTEQLEQLLKDTMFGSSDLQDLVDFLEEQKRQSVFIDVNAVPEETRAREVSLLSWVAYFDLRPQLRVLLEYADATGQLAATQHEIDPFRNPGLQVASPETFQLLRAYGIPMLHMAGSDLFRSVTSFYRTLFLDAAQMTEPQLETLLTEIRLGLAAGSGNPRYETMLYFLDESLDEPVEQALFRDLPVLGKLLTLFQDSGVPEERRLELYEHFRNPAIAHALTAGMLRTVEELERLIEVTETKSTISAKRL